MASLQPIRTRQMGHWPISCRLGQVFSLGPDARIREAQAKLWCPEVSGVTGKEGSDGEDRIRPRGEEQYPQWPMSDEFCYLSLTPGSRPASVDLATEAWRPRGRWAGTRRLGPHQTLASGLGPQHQSEASSWAWLLPPRRIHREGRKCCQVSSKKNITFLLIYPGT